MSIINERFKAGVLTENPVFGQVLSMCPTLAVSTSIVNAIGMGVASTVVLVGSNVVIAMIRKFIPDKIRIPAYITVIATFVTIIEFLLQGYVPSLYKSLGLFIPLIVVNCIILGRAEAYASKNNVIKSFWDGIFMGMGFTVALLTLGVIREILGSGSFLGYNILPFYQPALIMIMAPGAFLTLGFIMAFLNYRKTNGNKKTTKKEVI